eukprot:gene22810-28976_t
MYNMYRPTWTPELVRAEKAAIAEVYAHMVVSPNTNGHSETQQAKTTQGLFSSPSSVAMFHSIETPPPQLHQRACGPLNSTAHSGALVGEENQSMSEPALVFSTAAILSLPGKVMTELEHVTDMLMSLSREPPLMPFLGSSSRLLLDFMDFTESTVLDNEPVDVEVMAMELLASPLVHCGHAKSVGNTLVEKDSEATSVLSSPPPTQASAGSQTLQTKEPSLRRGGERFLQDISHYSGQ